jgi:hypothetical protein
MRCLITAVARSALNSFRACLAYGGGEGLIGGVLPRRKRHRRFAGGLVGAGRVERDRCLERRYLGFGVGDHQSRGAGIIHGGVQLAAASNSLMSESSSSRSAPARSAGKAMVISGWLSCIGMVMVKAPIRNETGGDATPLVHGAQVPRARRCQQRV